MKAVDFPESNSIFTLEGANDLPVQRGTMNAGSVMGTVPVLISCWELDEHDLVEIQLTKRIKLVIVGMNQPPVDLEVYHERTPGTDGVVLDPGSDSDQIRQQGSDRTNGTGDSGGIQP